MLSVQGGASIAKYLFHLLGPAGATTLRIGIAGILLMLINRPKLGEYTYQKWLYTIFYGCSIGAMNLLFYYGIQRVPLGLGVTVEFIGPLGLALVMSRRWSDLVWALLAVAGVILIVPSNGNSCDPVGLLFVFCAGLMWAAYIVAGGRITRYMKNSDAVSGGMMIALLVVLPFGIISGDLWRLNWTLLLIGSAVAIFSSALPFTLDLLALKRLSGKTFSILQSLQPAFGALSGLLFLGEFLSLRQYLAILCVVIASIGTTVMAKAE